LSLEPTEQNIGKVRLTQAQQNMPNLYPELSILMFQKLSQFPSNFIANSETYGNIFLQKQRLKL
jgi:hypothetical protein